VLLYSRPHPELFGSYNKSYGASASHFELANSAKNIVDLLAPFVVGSPPNVLEIGCGQGLYLQYVKSVLPDARCTGVDGSDVAIEQCAAAYADTDWACDTLDAFVADHDEQFGDRRYALILDKCGTTAIKDEALAETFLKGLLGLLDESGLYVYLGSKSFYDGKLRPRQYDKWTTDWRGLAASIFPYGRDLSDTGYYRHVYSRQPLLLGTELQVPPRRALGTPAPAPMTAPPKPAPKPAERSEDFPTFLRLLSRLSIEVPELVKWDDRAHYFEDVLDALPAPKFTVLESLAADGPFVALRHDCDNSLQNALAMARAEHLRGVRSTYYLLHPDGFVAQSNYYGSIVDGRLVPHPDLVAAAKYLGDLGHEVGLHNDFITLGLYLKRQPADLLREQLDFWRGHGVEMQGTASHGGALCGEHGFINYQLFSDFEREKVAEKYRSAEVTRDGFTIRKHAVSVAELGLRYEAYLAPRSGSLSDSSSQWALAMQAGTVKPANLAELRTALAGLAATERLQALLHPCHWLALVCGNVRAASAVAARFRASG
jgi:hypothetical protein